MPEAARVTDPISHTPVLAGILAGAALAVGVIAVVGTGGLAAPFVAAGVAAAAAGGGLAGGYIAGAMAPNITGAIVPLCSPNVIIGGLNAARALADRALCSGMLPLFPHSPPPVLIAEGSCTVFINDYMAARKTDHLVCGAVIADGCHTVFIGGGTCGVPGLAVELEVPSWVQPTLFGVMVVGSLIATGGTLAGFAVLGAGLLGSLGGTAIGGYVGTQIGEITGNKELGKRVGEVAGGILGGMAAGLGVGRAMSGPKPVETLPAPKKAGGAYSNEKTPMGESYRAKDADYGVKYLNDAELQSYRVVADPDGNLVYAESGKPVNTDRGIYVMDEHGNVFVHEQPKFGEIHHSSLAQGSDVAGAGGIKVQNGKVVHMDEGTGHYGSSQPSGRVNVVDNELQSQGVDMSGATIQSYGK